MATVIHLRSVVAVVREAVAEAWQLADFLIRKADDRWVLRPGEVLIEWRCPSCGATTRARMADQP